MKQRLQKPSVEEIQGLQKIFNDVYVPQNRGRDKFILDYREKLRTTVMATVVGCSVRNVQHVLRAHGFGDPETDSKYAPGEKDEILLEYASGMTAQEIADVHGRTYGAICSLIQRRVNPRRSRNGILIEGVQHHIDGNPSNNSPENLYLFRNIKEHNACHKSLNLCLLRELPGMLKAGIIKFKDGAYTTA
jgi:hypothetical protein